MKNGVKMTVISKRVTYKFSGHLITYC